MSKNIVSLAAIPSRFQNLEAVLFSISKQTVTPDAIYINLAQHYDRLNYTLSNSDIESVKKIAKPYKAKVLVGPDYGSMSKFFPVFGLFRNDNIILCDDDTTYGTNWLEGLVNAKSDSPAAFGYNGRCFMTNPELSNKMTRKVAGPCDLLSANNGILLNTGLIDYDEFWQEYCGCPEAKYAEDTFISLFLRYKNILRIAVSDSKLRIHRGVFSSINALHLEVNNRADNHQLTINRFEGFNGDSEASVSDTAVSQD